MAENIKKRIRRSAEERVAEIDASIASHENTIAKLKAKKEAILNPKPRPSKSAKMKMISAIAKEAGLSEEEVIKRLELDKNNSEESAE